MFARFHILAQIIMDRLSVWLSRKVLESQVRCRTVLPFVCYTLRQLPIQYISCGPLIVPTTPLALWDEDIKGHLWKHTKDEQRMHSLHATHFFPFLGKGQKTGTVCVELVHKTHQNGDSTNWPTAPSGGILWGPIGCPTLLTQSLPCNFFIIYYYWAALHSLMH